MAEQRVAISGPADWFECQIPGDFSSHQEGETIHIYSADGRMQLCIHAFWHPAKNVAPSEFLDPHTIFPQTFGLRKLARLQIPRASSFGVEGYSTVNSGISLWQRLFWPSRKRRWQAWTVRFGSVCLVCTVEQTTEAILTPERKEIARSIFTSIRFNEHPVALPEEFARGILRKAKRIFDEPARRVGALQLAIGDARINLLSFYRAYVKNPSGLSDIADSVLATVDRLLNWDSEDMEAELASVRERVMPMLAPEQVWKESLSDFVSDQWIAGLRIMYVVDEEDAYWYIRESLLERWGITVGELHELALKNLSSYFEQHAIDMTSVDGSNGPKLLMPSNADAYNSVQLLNQPFHRKLQRILGPEFAVGIPNRDFFVAVSLKNTDMLERVRGKVAADFQTMDHPLTDRILIVSTDGVSEYCDLE